MRVANLPHEGVGDGVGRRDTVRRLEPLWLVADHRNRVFFGDFAEDSVLGGNEGVRVDTGGARLSQRVPHHGHRFELLLVRRQMLLLVGRGLRRACLSVQGLSVLALGVKLRVIDHLGLFICSFHVVDALSFEVIIALDVDNVVLGEE